MSDKKLFCQIRNFYKKPKSNSSQKSDFSSHNTNSKKIGNLGTKLIVDAMSQVLIIIQIILC